MSVSVILNVYKRGYTLEKQIESILNQSINVKPEDIHIWYNNSESEQPIPNNKDIKTYHCNYNTKFFGRFTIPLLCKTKYIALLDDDIIPGHKWLENCINSISKKDGIYGGSGVITNGNTYKPNTKVGWNGLKSEEITEVDLVGHAWFFKQEYSKFMWLEKIPNWENGEDIFLSYMAQKNGVKTYVPPHPKNNTEVWCNDTSKSSKDGVNWGDDNNAHWSSNKTHKSDRDRLVIDLIKKGWKTIK